MRVQTNEGVWEYPEGTFPPGLAPAGTPAPAKPGKPRLVEANAQETEEAPASTTKAKARKPPHNKSRLADNK